MKSRPAPRLCGIWLLLWALAFSCFAAEISEGNFGAEKPGESAKPTNSKKRNAYPFSGEVETQDGNSIVLKGKRKNRVLRITPETRFIKEGTPLKREAVQPGAYVSGSARKGADGQEEAITVNLKPARPENSAAR